MKTHKKITSSLKESFKDIETTNFSNVYDFLTAVYTILLANYTNENEILIAQIHNHHKNLKQTIMKINIDFEDNVNKLLKKISNNSFTDCKYLFDNLNAIIVFCFNINQINNIFSYLNENKKLKSKLIFIINPETFEQSIFYETSLYSKKNIITLNEHIAHIISNLIKNPNILLKELIMITQAEWKKIILDWNLTEAYFAEEKSIPELFIEIAHKTPNSIALTFKDKNISYKDLNKLSSNLAWYLTHQVLQNKRKIIAFYMERSFESFINVLGILKTGSAYLPLHLYFPFERILTILEDAHADTIITQKKFLPFLKNLKYRNINIIPIETILEKHHTYPEYINKAYTDDLAYIIYTSGTTGKPKGIKISHKGVCNLATHVKKDFGVTHKTKVLQFAPLSFDASVYEWAGALLNGAELCILAEDELPPKGDLTTFMKEKKINFALLPPSILEVIDNSNLNELHTLVSGGEACTENIVNKWAPGRKLFNAYGPSEATVACSFTRCFPQKQITIGKPIQNVKLYILNKQKKPVPIGVPGELYIGGVGLAQGYLNQEELTEKAFITHHFSSDKTERIYKTGDQVRWLENGEIEYITRIDSQIKLEGYRIELGEIESIFSSFPDIESSCVTLHKIDDVHKQIIAFYILKKGIKELNTEALKKFIKEKLPPYMIPTTYIRLNNFPLTLTNKIDRKELIKNYEESKDKIFNTNNQKEITPILEQTWKDLLNCENINGNFFSLGGDSIKAIQFVAILRKHGYLITSKTLYENPTIEELKNFLKKAPTLQTLSVDKNSIVQGQIGLSPIQKWFFEHQFKNYNQWNQAFLFQRKIPINKEYFYKAWKLLLKHHDTFRLRYKIDGNKINQYYKKNADSFILKEFKLHHDKNFDADWITKESIKLQNSLNIEKGPVLAIGIFNHKGSPQRILIAIHHLLVDGVSWRILLEDLFSIYNQLSQFQEVKLLPKTDHYGTWVEALQKYATKESTKSQIPYWQSISQKIKKEKTSRINLIKDQKHFVFSCSKEITLALLQDLPSHYPLHINDILLAGLSYALYEESKNYEYVIDIEGHGREDCIEGADVTRTIGWFTTIFPVSLKIPPSFLKLNESSYGDLLLSIKKELRKIPDKGIGYGILKYLSKTSSEAYLADINAPILFNYLGQFDLVSKYQDTWSFALESPGNPLGTDYFGSNNYSRYNLEINILTIQESLCMNFNYNKHIYSDAKIRRLANNYKFALEKFIMIGKKLALGNLYLPSDYSLAKTTFDKSNNINKTIEDEPYIPFSLVNIVEYKNFISDISLIEDIYPASYLQKRMLLESQKDNNGTYHIVSNYSIYAPYDSNKIISIFEQLAKKHELLRASFLYKDGEYSIVVFKTSQIEYQFYENKISKELISKEKINDFNNNKPGLFRLLVNKKAHHFDLIFSFHNAIEDGWSMATLINEFGEAYINNIPIELELNLKYGEFVRNERAAIKNQANISFWKEYLDNYNVIKANWKSDNKKSESSSYQSFFSLDPQQVSLIHKISKELQISVDSIFLLTYLKTLSYFIGNSDIAVGIAANNRLEKENGDQLFGLFINIIPFRFNLKSFSNDFNCLLEVFNTKIKLQKYKSLPYDYIKSLYKQEFYEFVFDFVHLHLLSKRVSGIESTDGYERTHIPFTLTIVQKGTTTFMLSISAHDNFVDQEFLNHFISYYKKCLYKTSRFIQQEISQQDNLKKSPARILKSETSN